MAEAAWQIVATVLISLGGIVAALILLLLIVVTARAVRQTARGDHDGKPTTRIFTSGRNNR